MGWLREKSCVGCPFAPISTAALESNFSFWTRCSKPPSLSLSRSVCVSIPLVFLSPYCLSASVCPSRRPPLVSASVSHSSLCLSVSATLSLLSSSLSLSVCPSCPSLSLCLSAVSLLQLIAFVFGVVDSWCGRDETGAT